MREPRPNTAGSVGGRRAGLALSHVAIAIAAIASLMATAVAFLPGQRDRALAERTIRDAQAIADAAVRYQWRTGIWPTEVGQLAAELTGPVPVMNPFGARYAVSGSGRTVTVTTTIPLRSVPTSAGQTVGVVPLGTRSIVTVSRTLTESGTAPAAFDKKHLYLE